MSDSSWLIPDDGDRERMLDISRRIQPVRRKSFAVLAVALLVSGPWLGWWTILPLAVAAVVFKVADDRLERAARPEYAMFAAWAASEVIIAASVALTGGPKAATMAWLAIPIPTLTARFSSRGVAIGVGFALALVPIVGFGVDPAAVVHNPVLVIAPMALIVATAMLSTALAQSDIEHRNEAVIDQLTGILNRNALRTRVIELAQQSVVTRQPVGVIVGDLDRFKSVNDLHGHAVGDAVLKDVAYVIRKRLRAFDLAYRLGGEEFLVLVPGGDIGQTQTIAADLREAVAEATHGGMDVTMSFGVAASGSGEPFDFGTVFARADAALYEAKRCGRDRVCTDGEQAASPVAVG
jgi:diguanylate cyclase (GGDEF)-like protein